MKRQSDSRYERPGVTASTLLALLGRRGGAGGADGVSQMPSQAWHEVFELARRHGVTPLVHRDLRETGALASVPEPVRSRLGEDRRATALDNLRNYGEFRRIAQALRERRIPVMALKGLHLAELVYGDISLRTMVDLDVLVPRTELERTLVTLQSLEYGCDGDLSGAASGMPGTKCNIGLAHRRLGIWLEIHWTLAEPGEVYAPPMDEIWRSAEPARLGDADALVMSAEFLLLYVCAHLACNHVFGFSVRGLCDIAEIVQACPRLDWGRLAEKGGRYGWTRGVAAALRLARDHLGAKVPAEALAALGGDALDPAMLAEALEHMLTFSGMPGELTTAPNLLAIAGGGSVSAKCAILWKRIFVPRAELALRYGVPQHSARLRLYYAVRMRDLIRRYAAGAWALSVSDSGLAAMAERHARLARWIAGG